MPNTLRPRLVVITFQQLAASALGCYGNEWVETPTLDQLAANGAVMTGFRTCRQAWNQLAPSAGLPTNKMTVLVEETSTAPTLPSHLPAACNCRTIAGPVGWDAPPSEVRVAKLFQAAAIAVQEEEPDLLWIVGEGVSRPWQPPTGFATLYFEDFADRGLPLSETTQEGWDTHPAVYAGAVSLLDHWLGHLMDQLRASDRPSLVMVIGQEGAQWQSEEAEPAELNSAGTHSEELSAPLILSPIGDWAGWPDLASWHCPYLTTPEVLWPSVLQGLQQSPAEATRTWLNLLTGSVEPASAVCLKTGLRDVVETRDWKGVFAAESVVSPMDAGHFESFTDASAELYSRPDDHWDVNDLATSRPDVLHTLHAHRMTAKSTERNPGNS